MEDRSLKENELIERYMYLVHRSVGKYLKRVSGFEKDDLMGYGILGLWEGLQRAKPDEPLLENFLSKTIKYKIINGIYLMRGLKPHWNIELKSCEVSCDPAIIGNILETNQFTHFPSSPFKGACYGNENEVMTNRRIEYREFLNLLSMEDKNLLEAYFQDISYQEVADKTNKSLISVYKTTQCILKLYQFWLYPDITRLNVGCQCRKKNHYRVWAAVRKFALEIPSTKVSDMKIGSLNEANPKTNAIQRIQWGETKLSKILQCVGNNLNN